MNRGFIGALCFSVPFSLLAGCGASTPPIGAPGVTPQSRAIAQHVARGKSWMLRKAKDEDLIYAPGECGGTCVLSYPSGKQVGALDVGGIGACSDTQGNVFITHGNNGVSEYAHGGTTLIQTLILPGAGAVGCSVDPTTNNLAVMFGGSGLAVFTNESGSATAYHTGLESAEHCGYDNVGNLFIAGNDYLGKEAISELPQGQASVVPLSINGELPEPGQIQWDGSYMSYESDLPDFTIIRLSIVGSVATPVGTTTFKGHMSQVNQTWLFRNVVLAPYGGKVENTNKVGVWPYPDGGTPKRMIKFPRSKSWGFDAVTVSVAPSR